MQKITLQNQMHADGLAAVTLLGKRFSQTGSVILSLKWQAVRIGKRFSQTGMVMGWMGWNATRPEGNLSVGVLKGNRIQLVAAHEWETA